MINVWNPYQAERNFRFSRIISYYATGTFRGVGVRDTAQDILAVIPFDLRRAKELVELHYAVKEASRRGELGRGLGEAREMVERAVWG